VQGRDVPNTGDAKPSLPASEINKQAREKRFQQKAVSFAASYTREPGEA
jgi:hypothetical protein